MPRALAREMVTAISAASYAMVCRGENSGLLAWTAGDRQWKGLWKDLEDLFAVLEGKEKRGLSMEPVHGIWEKSKEVG